MNSIASTSTPASFAVARPRANSVLSLRVVVLLAAISCLLTFVLNAYWRESYTGDEGFYGVTAQNMLHAPSYWLRPSYFPLGDFLTDQDGFAHPPFNSYAYAVGLWLARGSLVGPEVVNLIALAALLFASYRVLARVDPLGAKLGVLLLAASPAITGYYSMLEAEPLLTTCGLLSLFCSLEGGFGAGGRRWLFASGLWLGLAFALKLWLFGPLALAVAAALVFRALLVPVAWRDYLAGTALFALGVILPAGAHLAAIAAFYPQDLGFWLKKIYFGIVTKSGISGSKFGGDAIPANWVHPVWYYGAALYRDNFFLLPPILFGAVSAWRESARKRRLLLILGAGIAGVIPLSLIKVKEPLYVLTCAVFLYLLAATCLSTVVRRLATGRALDRVSWLVGTMGTAALLLAVPAAYLRGVQADKISLGFMVAHSVVLLAFLGALFRMAWTRLSGVMERTVYLGCAATVAITVGLAAVTHRPRDVAIVRLVKPELDLNTPRQMSMFASNFKNYQYYAFAKGCYWHELDPTTAPDALLALPEYRHVRVFIMSPEDQQVPANRRWLHWLEANAVDRTPELDRDLGTVSGYRLFVRELPDEHPTRVARVRR